MEIINSKKIQKKCNKWRLIPYHGESRQFYHEKSQIRCKFSSVGYSIRFLNSVTNDFENKEPDLMTPSYLFNDFESKRTVLIDIPFCSKSERVSK